MGCFPLQPYRSETYRISLFHEEKSKVNDYHTKEIATVRYDTIRYDTIRYDTIEMENRLNTNRISEFRAATVHLNDALCVWTEIYISIQSTHLWQKPDFILQKSYSNNYSSTDHFSIDLTNYSVLTR